MAGDVAGLAMGTATAALGVAPGGPIGVIDRTGHCRLGTIEDTSRDYGGSSC